MENSADDSKSTTASVAVPVLPHDACQMILPDYCIDMLVKIASLFSSIQSWKWRQLVVHGQTLRVLDRQQNVVATVQTPTCSLRALADHTFHLLDGTKIICTLYSPSPTVHTKLTAVLRASAATPYWVQPPRDVFQDLLDVASSIVETSEADRGLKPVVSVAATDVTAYLDNIAAIYDMVCAAPSQAALYDILCCEEGAYMANRATVCNFASLVRRFYSSKDDYATDACRSCPHCDASLASDIAFAVRVVGATDHTCPSCGHHLLLETFRLGAFRRATPAIHFTVQSETHKLALPRLPPDGTVASYRPALVHMCRAFHSKVGKSVPQSARVALVQQLLAYLEPLDLVRAMGHHLGFAAQICANLTYWRRPVVIHAALERYRQFCYLVNTTIVNPTVPTIDIALVRYVHQTVATPPMAFFHVPHHPDEVDAAYADTFLRWADAFDGHAYSSFPPSFAAWSRAKGQNAINQLHLKAKWDKLVRLPAKDSRFVGVDESYDAMIIHDVAAFGNTTQDRNDTVVPTPVLAVIGTPLLEDRVPAPRHLRGLVKGRASLLEWRAIVGVGAWLQQALVGTIDDGSQLGIHPIANNSNKQPAVGATSAYIYIM
ncbi:Aste57867_8831 [Aphanomyces stellatus]|uniref:Aste57867_8831 protein n=1 Tax=Aphanomyces stellatus TaxID=120398 RepID=A0A485KLG5_9STRA|nr:hypothetical protein As57867_008796 [Aphanomyces stellatus]VFT85717.1 Aste57867_8831 [Aphanomyces stellatus]